MLKPKKVISLVLVAVVVMALVAGAAYWSVGYNPDSVKPGLYPDGKNKVDDPGAIVTVDGHEVSFELYRHAYLINKFTFTSYYGEDYFDHDPDGSIAEYLREYTDDNVRQWYAWMDIGTEIGVTADEALLAEVEEEIAADKETYGAQFESRLADMFLVDEDNYREVLTIQKLVAKVQEAYTEHVEAEAGDDLLDSVATAKHILITADGFAENEEEYEALMAGETAAPEADEEAEADEADGEAADADADADVEGADADDAATAQDGDETEAGADASEVAQEEAAEDASEVDGEADDADAQDAGDGNEAEAGDEAEGEFDEDYYTERAEAFAVWIVEQIEASDDPAATFEEMRALYDEDPGQQAEDYTGYTFAEGSMVDEFYQEAMALGVNEISSTPVATDYGFHILLRLPLDETAVEEEGTLDTILNNMVSEKFNDVVDAQVLVYGAYYDSVTPAAVR